jgi:CRP-like cAMP-binding protein
MEHAARVLPPAPPENSTSSSDGQSCRSEAASSSSRTGRRHSTMGMLQSSAAALANAAQTHGRRIGSRRELPPQGVPLRRRGTVCNNILRRSTESAEEASRPRRASFSGAGASFGRHEPMVRLTPPELMTGASLFASTTNTSASHPDDFPIVALCSCLLCCVCLCFACVQQRRLSKSSLEDEQWLESIMGSTATLMDSEKRFREDSYLTEMYSQEALRRVIMPFSRFRRTWDIVTLILVLYTAIWLPIVICFLDGSQTPTRVIDVFTDIIFLIDVGINFHTAFITKDAVLEIDKKTIRRHYLTSWFPVDAVGSIPWEIITLFGEAAGFSASDGQGLQIIKILKTPKLLRLGRLFKFLARFEGAANIGRILILMFLFILLLHWLACGFFLVSDFNSEQGTGNTWLDTDRFIDATIPSKYARSYYIVIMMIMGDNIEPTHDSETVFAIIVGILGSCVNAIIFANVANLTAQLNSNSAQHQRRMDSVTQAMRKLHIEPSTARRIRNYYEYVWVRHRDHQGDQFIRTLPQQLRQRTSCMMHEGRIRSCPLFSNLDKKFIAALSTTLLPEVYLPAEFIVFTGFVSRAMYFIARGRVNIIRRGKNGQTLTDECVDYFDEMGLFTEKSHSLHARSITHTDLYKLERVYFERMVKDFPTAGWAVATAAKKNLSAPQALLIAQVIEDVRLPATTTLLVPHLYHDGVREAPPSDRVPCVRLRAARRWWGRRMQCLFVRGCRRHRR